MRGLHMIRDRARPFITLRCDRLREDGCGYERRAAGWQGADSLCATRNGVMTRWCFQKPVRQLMRQEAANEATRSREDRVEKTASGRIKKIEDNV